MTTVEIITVISSLILISAALTLYLMLDAPMDPYEPHTKDLYPDESEKWFWRIMILVGVIAIGCILYIINGFLN